MPVSTYVLYLDAAHLADALFVQSLARAFGSAGGHAPAAVVVHGSGEAAERLLEGEGVFVERVGGVLQVTSPAEAALVERATRLVNRHLAGLFTDAVVPSVGLVGTDRRLLAARADGTVAVRQAEMLRRLVGQRVLPVVGAVAVDDEGRAGEVAPIEVAVAVAQAFEAGEAAVVFFTRTSLPGILEGRSPRPRVGLDELPAAGVVPEPEAVRRVVEAGLPVLLTNTARLVEKGGAVGTWIVR